MSVVHLSFVPVVHLSFVSLVHLSFRSLVHCCFLGCFADRSAGYVQYAVGCDVNASGAEHVHVVVRIFSKSICS